MGKQLSGEKKDYKNRKRGRHFFEFLLLCREIESADKKLSIVMKDSAIKLFGNTIILLPEKVVSDVSVSEQRQISLATSTSQDKKDESGGSYTGSRHEYKCINHNEETLTETATSSEISDDNTNTLETQKEEEPSESNNASQEKTLKKPDKILSCPRCSSTDTKFCYYNNYNVNQPRYFCKNCQRYWTSGGTIRNLPVGSGRRKNKNAKVKNFHHIMVAGTLQAAPNGFLIGPSSFPVSFHPYWESALPSPWNVPLVSSAVSTSTTSSLGKHSREGTIVCASELGKENLNAERPVLIPKTLRIHDPSEAAKSSIWSTLGIKNEKTGSLSGTGLFKAFESKGHMIVDNMTMVLQANPAALSRSLNFHEST